MAKKIKRVNGYHADDPTKKSRKRTPGTQDDREVRSSREEEPTGASIPEAPTSDGTASRVPALAAYLDRVGAVEYNFRRFIIREHRGKQDHYYVERTIIKIESDGSIYCSRREHEPTEAEAKAIKEAFVKLTLPKSEHVNLNVAQAFANSLRGQSFLFFDRRSGKVRMIQERWIKTDGGKVYLPWTRFSDGVWRRMEPDGDLPFWKPLPRPNKRIPSKKLIHEGAKAAYLMTRLLEEGNEEELERHPWGDFIRQYEHWGMIGGALAPHRADYAELRYEKPTEVIYACDRDYAGESALQEVSKLIGMPMKGIMYGDAFNESFDMGDDLREKYPKYFSLADDGREVYSGPKIRELLVPATRATEVYHPPKGKPTPVLLRQFKEEWLHSIQPEVYIHRDWPHEMWTPSEFNNKVRPYSDVDDTARLLKRDAAGKGAVLSYKPGKKPGVYGSGDEGRYINTFKPTQVEPVRGDPELWLDFMRGLIADDVDREHVLRWCATLVAEPGTRMTYGVLLISDVQGVGKSTLGEKVLAPLVGYTNVSYPSEHEIVESNYNYWLAHKRLAVVHEIYAGHSAKAYNKLKSIVTDKYIQVSKKYMAEYLIENHMHVLAMSNSYRALQLSDEDRRWLVPRVTDDKRDHDYWTRLNKWLAQEDGLGIILWWAREYVKKNGGVKPGQAAPWTSLKDEVIEEGYSPGQALVAKTIDRVDSILKGDSEEAARLRARWEAEGSLRDGKVILVDTQLVKLITDVVHQGRQSDRLEKPLTVRKVAKTKKWHVGREKVSTGMSAWGNVAHNGRVISNVRSVAEKHPSEIGGAKVPEEKRLKPLDLSFMKEV